MQSPFPPSRTTPATLLPLLKRLLPPSSHQHSSFSSSSPKSHQIPNSQPPTPPIGSPARIQKLIASQSDPLLAKEIFDLASSLNPSLLLPSSYPSLHTLILKLARSRHFSLSDSLLLRLPSPSPGLFSSLFLTYSSLRLPHRALSTFRLMLRSNCNPRPKHFNRLLSALAAHPSFLPSALSLLNSADSLRVPTNVRSHNILIHAFCRAHKLSVAYSLFNRMFDRGLVPDVESYRILMQGLCRKSQVNTAVDLLEDMLNKGFVPDALSYTTLLNSLCRKKRLREAYKLLCRMKVKGCNPDIVHYNTVILGFCREGRPLDACKVIEDMPANGCLPNLVSYTTLVIGLCGRGLLDEAKGYLEEMVKKGLVPHFSVFHALVKGFCNLGKIEEACGVMGEMLRQGVAPHPDTWMAVVVGVCDDGGEKLEEIVEKVVREGEWRRGTRIVQAGVGLEEYMIRRVQSRKMWKR